MNQAEYRVLRQGYVHRVLVAFDQLLNVIFLGHPDETISSRCYRYAKRGNRLAKAICWVLDLIQPRHGQLARQADLGRAEVVEKIEKSRP